MAYFITLGLSPTIFAVPCVILLFSAYVGCGEIKPPIRQRTPYSTVRSTPFDLTDDVTVRSAASSCLRDQ